MLGPVHRKKDFGERRDVGGVLVRRWIRGTAIVHSCLLCWLVLWSSSSISSICLYLRAS